MKKLKTILSTLLIVISIVFVLITMNPYPFIDLILEIDPSTVNICDAFIEIYNNNIGFTVFECISILIICTWIIVVYLEGYNNAIKNKNNNN